MVLDDRYFTIRLLLYSIDMLVYAFQLTNGAFSGAHAKTI